MRRWLPSVVIMMTSPATAFAQAPDFAFRQVWALGEPLAPGEVEILCMYDDNVSAAIRIYDVPGLDGLASNTIYFPLLRISLDRLRESVGTYIRWRGPPEGGGGPLFDCASPQFQNEAIYDKPIADLIQEAIDWERAHPGAGDQ